MAEETFCIRGYYQGESKDKLEIKRRKYTGADMNEAILKSQNDGLVNIITITSIQEQSKKSVFR